MDPLILAALPALAVIVWIVWVLLAQRPRWIPAQWSPREWDRICWDYGRLRRAYGRFNRRCGLVFLAAAVAVAVVWSASLCAFLALRHAVMPVHEFFLPPPWAFYLS